MNPERFLRATGRAVTDVSTTGRIEIAGTSHEAVSNGAAVPAGSPVVVTGWRLVGGTAYVLAVRLRLETEPEVSPHAEQLVPTAPSRPESESDGSELGWWLLTFGQIVSVLVCVASVVSAMFALAQASFVQERVKDVPNSSFCFVSSCVILFGYSAAIFVVFSRVKRLPPN